jgi:hypothetical protein
MHNLQGRTSIITEGLFTLKSGIAPLIVQLQLTFEELLKAHKEIDSMLGQKTLKDFGKMGGSPVKLS